MKKKYYSDFTETFYFDIKLGEVFKFDEISLEDVEVVKHSGLYYGAKGLIYEYTRLEEKLLVLELINKRESSEKKILELELLNKRLEIQGIVASNVVNMVKYKKLVVDFTVQDVMDLWSVWKCKYGLKGMTLAVLDKTVDFDVLGVVDKEGVYTIKSLDTFVAYLGKNVPLYEKIDTSRLRFLQAARGVGFALAFDYFVEDVSNDITLKVDFNLVYAGVDYTTKISVEEYNLVYLALKEFIQYCENLG